MADLLSNIFKIKVILHVNYWHIVIYVAGYINFDICFFSI